MGSDGKTCQTITYLHKFQSTLPHGERLTPMGEYQYCISVSIHAPAWGATYFDPVVDDWTPVSIHAPAWGATVSI